VRRVLGESLLGEGVVFKGFVLLDRSVWKDRYWGDWYQEDWNSEISIRNYWYWMMNIRRNWYQRSVSEENCKFKFFRGLSSIFGCRINSLFTSFVGLKTIFIYSVHVFLFTLIDFFCVPLHSLFYSLILFSFMNCYLFGRYKFCDDSSFPPWFHFLVEGWWMPTSIRNLMTEIITLFSIYNHFLFFYFFLHMISNWKLLYFHQTDSNVWFYYELGGNSTDSRYEREQGLQWKLQNIE